MAQPKKRLPEAHMRFYAAEVLLALQYLHLLGFVYRCFVSLICSNINRGKGSGRRSHSHQAPVIVWVTPMVLICPVGRSPLIQ